MRYKLRNWMKNFNHDSSSWRDNDARRERWQVSDSKLKLIESYGSSLYSQIEKIEITHLGLILQYKVDSSINIKLRIIPGQHRSVPNILLSEGTYEKFEMDIFLKFAKISKNFLDVGANCGYYSVCAQKANKNLVVASSEPNTHVLKELTSNLKLNDIDSVTIMNYALANTNSDTETFFVPKFIGTAGGSLSNLHPDDSEIIDVKVRTLDTISQELNKNFDLIKIDIEGSEYEFLKGGGRTIQAGNPIIFVELLRKWMKNFNSNPQIFLSTLENMGYNCYGIADNFLKVTKLIDEETIETNFIFVPRHNENALKIINNYL